MSVSPGPVVCDLLVCRVVGLCPVGCVGREPECFGAGCHRRHRRVSVGCDSLQLANATSGDGFFGPRELVQTGLQCSPRSYPSSWERHGRCYGIGSEVRYNELLD